MLNPTDLLHIARDLVDGHGRPSTTRCARAISSTYYALFHCLARDCADLMIGSAGADRSFPAWRQVYRALDHGTANKRCRNQQGMKVFSVEVQNFAEIFVALQEKRHNADYDPLTRFSKSEVISDIDSVAIAIERYRSVAAKDRRAFCAFVLFANRSGQV